MFEILNTAILAVVFYWIAQRKLIPMLYKNMMQEQAYQESLVHEKASLEKTIEALTQERVQQQVECDLMQKKVLLWKQAAASVQKERAIEDGRCIEAQTSRQRIVDHYRQTRTLYKQIHDDVVTLVCKDLDTRFKDEKNAQDYLDTVMNSLKEKDGF